MENHRPIDDRAFVPSSARCVLIALHGREPTGWAPAVCRALTLSPAATVRVLAVTDVPAPPSVALLRSARRARARARAEWRRIQVANIAQRLEALLARLSVVPEVAWVDVTDADPGRTIAERAAAWGADLVVVGVDRTSWLERRFLGAIHERVVAQAGCAVLVVPPPERALGRLASASGGRGPRPAAAKGGA
ncbi:MAG TPA: universal stress protein [Methylomirabilota bacterium]|jgi:nucleotide-binding universal stress UspA family protein